MPLPKENQEWNKPNTDCVAIFSKTKEKWNQEWESWIIARIKVLYYAYTYNLWTSMPHTVCGQQRQKGVAEVANRCYYRPFAVGRHCVSLFVTNFVTPPYCSFFFKLEKDKLIYKPEIAPMSVVNCLIIFLVKDKCQYLNTFHFMPLFG